MYAQGQIAQKYNRWNPIPKELEEKAIAFYLERDFYNGVSCRKQVSHV